MENNYQKKIEVELKLWQRRMCRGQTFAGNLSKSIQDKINSVIPAKVHKAITVTIKQMVRAVLFGSSYTVPKNTNYSSIEETEIAILQKINNYKKTAAVEGGLTGAGGILLGFVDFPVLLGIKIKLLFDIAAMYGFDVKDYKERLYILYIFQLAFSSQKFRKNIYKKMENWDQEIMEVPDDIHGFDWQSFQQEYRDHIDLVKMAQLIPGIGAVIGLVANYQLIKKLGTTAMNAYRMRLEHLISEKNLLSL
ncbi:MAG: EcsC family protein [Chitinophagaceae bacterium]